MRKLFNISKIISLVLTVAVLASAFSDSIVAIDAINVVSTSSAKAGVSHIHCICGGTASGKNGHVCSDSVEWQPLDSSVTVLPTSGNYYLASNVSIPNSSAVTLTGDLHICFNGYKIIVTNKSSRIFNIPSSESGIHLSFCDCASEYHGGINHQLCSREINGVIVDTAADWKTPNIIDVFGGEFNLNGSFCSSGGIFAVRGKTELNIYGGKYMRDNTTNIAGLDKTWPACTYGGAICALETATVNIYDGTFQNCAATNGAGTAGYGGAVCARGSSKVYISGGKYINCSAVTSGAIGSIQLPTSGGSAPELHTSGTITVKDCSPANSLFSTVNGGILDNKATVVSPEPEKETAGHKNHCYCGGLMSGKNGHVCSGDVEWQPLDSSVKVLPSSGNYYLESNISISNSSPVSLTGDLHICFNGYKINVTSPSSGVFTIPSSERGTRLSFCDCVPEYHGGINHQLCKKEINGVILDTAADWKTPNTIDVFGGEFNLNGSFCSSGGIFAVRGKTVLNIYGGKYMRDNTVNVTGLSKTRPACTYGGAICALETAVVNIYNGTFENCVATNGAGTAGYGGAVCARGSSKVYISGGKYINCSAVTSGAIGSIQLPASGSAPELHTNGTIIVEGCTPANSLFSSASGGVLDNKATVISSETGGGSASEHKNHCYCGGAQSGKNGHVCSSNVEWQPLSPSDNFKLPTSGCYYLTDNITINSNPETLITNDLHICFNGFKIIVKRSGYMYYMSDKNTRGVNVSFCDCRSELGGGITQQNCAGQISGAIFNISYSPKSLINTVDVFGGVFDVRNSYYSSGGIFCVKDSNILNIYGGTFLANGATKHTVGGSEKTRTNSTYGGAVFAINTSKVNVYGGDFSGCTATDDSGSSGFGGAFCTNNSAVLTISGGYYLNCTAVSGGGIAAARGTSKVYVNGRIGDLGCKASKGGLFYVESGSKLYVENGAYAYGGNATVGGGTVYNQGSYYQNGGTVGFGNAPKGGTVFNEGELFEVKGGMLVNGIAGEKGGNIYTNTAMTVSGGIITGGEGGNPKTFNNANGGGNIYVEKANDVFAVTMTGGIITDGIAHCAGGNIFVGPSVTFNQLGGTVTNGYVDYISGSPYYGGNVYLRGTYKMDKVEGVAEPIVTDGKSSGGGGNFSLNLSGARLIINAGTVKNGRSASKNQGNIYCWYAADKDAVQINGGTVTNDIKDDFTTYPYFVGGIYLNVSGDYLHYLNVGGDAEIDDCVFLQKPGSGKSIALVKINDGFTGHISNIKITASTRVPITLGAGESYQIGTGWGKDYIASGNILPLGLYADYSFEDGNVKIFKSEFFKNFESFSAERNILKIEEYKNFISTFEALDETAKQRSGDVESTYLTVKDILTRYDNMLKIHIAVTDNYGANKDKVLVKLYSSMDEKGIDDGNAGLEYGYDYGRIVYTLNGETFGENEKITDVYKTVSFNSENLINADKETLYEYVYFTEFVLDKEAFSNDAEITATASITTVNGKTVDGESRTVKLSDIYPINKTEETPDIRANYGATKEEAERLEAQYEGLDVYYGEMHDHSESGGTSDGKCALSDMKEKINEVGLDFIAILDHKQILHMESPYWEDNFIGGSEPGAMSIDGTYLHYNIIFDDAEAFKKLIESFPEFKASVGNGTNSHTGVPYTNEWHFGYPDFTRERFIEFAQAIKDAGGYLVLPHPIWYVESGVRDQSDPTCWYYGDNIGLEVLYETVDSSTTPANYDLWRALLSTGARVFASAGGDGHINPDNEAMTTLYAEDNNSSSILSVVKTGNTTAGGLAIRMTMGDIVTGGHKVFSSDEKLIISVGDFHYSLKDENYQYRVAIYKDEELIADQALTTESNNYFALPVEEDAHYYRAVVYRNDKNNTIVAYGNPIWNDAF